MTDPRHGRIRFRAWRRGFKEADLILGHFADQHLDKLSPAQLDAFEALLDESDQDIYAWLLQREPAPPRVDADLLGLIRSFGQFARTLWAHEAR